MISLSNQNQRQLLFQQFSYLAVPLLTGVWLYVYFSYFIFLAQSFVNV